MLERVRNSLISECKIGESDTIVIGVSGGADSVCLLDILYKLGYRFVVAHLDHQLRPSAQQEALFVQGLAQKYRTEFVLKRVSIAQVAMREKKGIEETAREERYHFLFSTAEKYYANAVAVAHQADDQVETILMNFIRGAGLNGLGGMDSRSFSYHTSSIPLIRPLLSIWREEIIHYCQETGLEFMIDESNRDTTFLRNRIRYDLIPYLMNYNPNIKQGLLRMGSLMKCDQSLLDGLANEAEREIGLTISEQFISFDLDRFNSLHPSLQQLMIKKILVKFDIRQQRAELRTIEAIRQFFSKNNQVLDMQMGSDLLVLREQNKGIITTNIDSVWDDAWPVIEGELIIPLTVGEHHISKHWRIRLEETNRGAVETCFRENRNALKAYLDSEALADPLLIRGWLPGDRFQPMGMRGRSMKLSDFWINRKIPKRARVKWPLVFSGQRVAWVPGFQPSFDTCISEKTQGVVIISLLREEK